MSLPRDNNRKSVAYTTSAVDGLTLQALQVTGHSVATSDGTGGTPAAQTANVQRDANRDTATWGVSSADGKTLVAIYSDSSGNLLTQST